MLALQQQLSELGYWLGTPDGAFGSLTQQAVWALQKSAGLSRDGVVGPRTRAALAQGVRPKATIEDGVEIDLGRQILVVVRDGRVRMILNTSTGNGEEYTEEDKNTPGELITGVALTPSGLHKVNR